MYIRNSFGSSPLAHHPSTYFIIGAQRRNNYPYQLLSTWHGKLVLHMMVTCIISTDSNVAVMYWGWRPPSAFPGSGSKLLGWIFPPFRTRMHALSLAAKIVFVAAACANTAAAIVVFQVPSEASSVSPGPAASTETAAVAPAPAGGAAAPAADAASTTSATKAAAVRPAPAADAVAPTVPGAHGTARVAWLHQRIGVEGNPLVWTMSVAYGGLTVVAVALYCVWSSEVLPRVEKLQLQTWQPAGRAWQ